MGVGFFLGILYREGASNSEGKVAPLASSLCSSRRPLRGSKSEPRARGLTWRALPARSGQCLGASGGLRGPPPHPPGIRAQEAEGLPRRRGAGCVSSASWDSLPLSFSQRVPPARAAPPRGQQNLAPALARESAGATALLRAPRSRPSEGLEGGGGAGKGEASPPPWLRRCLHPKMAPPHCLADGQWKQITTADDAEIRHGGAVRPPESRGDSGSTAPSAA